MSNRSVAQSRISIETNRGISAALFSVAIITYATRTYIRARMLKKFMADDFILFFAVLSLIAATGLTFTSLQHQYDLVAVVLQGITSDPVSLMALLDEAVLDSKEQNAQYTVFAAAVFGVKLAFLFFFRRLVYRVRDLRIWWYFVVAFTVLAGFTSVAVGWLTCPDPTIQGVLTCAGAEGTYRVLRDSGITAAMDIASDILLVSIPCMLLWRVQLQLRQKVALGVSLCLSLIMISVAVVRMAGMRLGENNVDVVWIEFWLQQECSIAVTMVSVSAFRSFFVASSSNDSPARRQVSRPWRTRLARKYWNMDNSGEDGADVLPQVPGATLTGMRTMIAGAGTETIISTEKPEPEEGSVEP